MIRSLSRVSSAAATAPTRCRVRPNRRLQRAFSLDARSDHHLHEEDDVVDSQANHRTAPSFSMGLRSLPERFLREMDENNFDPSTYQRINVAFDSKNGKPLNVSTSSGGGSSSGEEDELKYTIKSRVWEADTQVIEWADGVVSRYPRQWMDHVLQSMESTMAQPTLWTNLDEQTVRNSKSLSMDFENVLDDSSEALKSLFQYGILLVTNTPTEDGGAGLGALAAALSGGTEKINTTSLLQSYKDGNSDTVLEHGTDGPMRTLYGNIWSTVSSGQQAGTSRADSAYTNDSLPLHSDMTYYRDPPGLQIFTMKQVADRGGESVYADGFAVAAIIQQEHPEAFETLSTVERTYRCVDAETGWHLEAKGPIVRTNSNGQIVGIRHNDLDRMPDLPPLLSDVDIHEYYQKLAHAHRVWDETLARDDVRLVMKLQPGDTCIVANQRCLHARYSFETSPERPRAIMGCYVSQEELNSRFRMEGLYVPQ